MAKIIDYFYSKIKLYVQLLYGHYIKYQRENYILSDLIVYS